MKASLEWVKQLLPDLSATPDEIDRRLTDAGIEVEETVRQADAFTNFVTGEVKSLDAHPNADKLRVAQVFDGTDTHTVVCGAPNVAAGQKIIFAQLGAVIPNGGFTIEPRKIRGVASAGMICSGAELGVSEDSDGIMVLDADVEAGQPIAPLIQRTDVVFELGVTPNRPDVLSQLGVARELAALYGLPLPSPSVELAEEGETADSKARISIQDGDKCPRYLGRVIDGVEIKPSPAWVAARLEAIGLRPISNVVDATNLALHELGHPLHAFDLDKLNNQEIIVRTAKAGETLTTLDDVERKLDADDLVIADGERPVALAGVMGGANSEVFEGTRTVLLEGAMFEPGTVRRSARRHGLHTDASHRFERGADPLAIERAIDRCAELIVELAGGKVLPGRIEVVESTPEPRVVGVRPSRAALLLGRTVDADEVNKTLTALGLQEASAPEGAAEEALHYSIPSWRVDLNIEEDLIEEVARVAGYDTIPTVMPPLTTAVLTRRPATDPADTVRRALISEGFHEAVSLAFSSHANVEGMGFDASRAVELANPLGAERALMRMSLVPGLLRAVQLNQGLRRTDLRLFEVGRSFHWADDKDELPVETMKVALVLRGRRQPESWNTDATEVDAFDLKGTLEQLLQAFNVNAGYDRDDSSWLHPRTATVLSADGARLGVAGAVHPDTMTAFGLKGPPVFVAELDVQALADAQGGLRKFHVLPKFPAVGRDLSFFIDRDVPVAKILATAEKPDVGLEAVDVFDVYEGKGLPEGKRSIAIRLTFRSADRTLTDAEVDASFEVITKALAEGVGAEIRSGN